MDLGGGGGGGHTCTAIVPFNPAAAVAGGSTDFPALPDWKSFVESDSDTEMPICTPPPSRRPQAWSQVVLSVNGNPQSSSPELSLIDDVLLTPPLPARHSGVTAAVKLAKAQVAAGQGKGKGKAKAKGKGKPIVSTVGPKMTAKNVHSRAYHQARKAAERRGLSTERAKELTSST